jgi:hypothetical protein
LLAEAWISKKIPECGGRVTAIATPWFLIYVHAMVITNAPEDDTIECKLKPVQLEETVEI